MPTYKFTYTYEHTYEKEIVADNLEQAYDLIDYPYQTEDMIDSYLLDDTQVEILDNNNNNETESN